MSASRPFEEIVIRSWPSRDCLPIGVLRYSPDELFDRLGIHFKEGEEDGLGVILYSHLRLSTGDQILLAWYRAKPHLGTGVYADSESDFAEMRERFLAATLLCPTDFTWLAPQRVMDSR